MPAVLETGPIAMQFLSQQCINPRMGGQAEWAYIHPQWYWTATDQYSKYQTHR